MAESVLGCILRKQVAGSDEVLIVFDSNIIQEPLWLPEKEWKQLLLMRLDIKQKNYTHYELCQGQNQEVSFDFLRKNMAGVVKELDFSPFLMKS